MHTTIEQSHGSVDSSEHKVMTAYVRLKDSAGYINTYPNVKAIEWEDKVLVIHTKGYDVRLNEVFTCEIN